MLHAELEICVVSHALEAVVAVLDTVAALDTEEALVRGWGGRGWNGRGWGGRGWGWGGWGGRYSPWWLLGTYPGVYGYPGYYGYQGYPGYSGYPVYPGYQGYWLRISRSDIRESDIPMITEGTTHHRRTTPPPHPAAMEARFPGRSPQGPSCHSRPLLPPPAPQTPAVAPNVGETDPRPWTCSFVAALFSFQQKNVTGWQPVRIDTGNGWGGKLP